jgi:phosphatidate cytidylyltransferase
MNPYLLTNPFINPLASQLLFRQCIMFSVGALALAAVHLWRVKFAERGDATQALNPPEKVLWLRYGTWVAIALIFTGALLTGPLAIAVLCAFICWQGGREYAALILMPTSHYLVLVLGGLATLAAVLYWGASALAIAPVLAFFGWSLLALQPVQRETECERRFTTGLAGFWGYLYLGWLPAFVVALSMSKMPGLVLAAGLGVALSDIGAFCTGKLLRGPRLAPRLSPNKTWSGLLGNILGAALAVTLTAFALPALPLWQRVLLIAAVGLGSAWGDLLESLLKRQGKVKDAGELLPGFGGLLDRADSFLMVVPLVYYTVSFSSALKL